MYFTIKPKRDNWRKYLQMRSEMLGGYYSSRKLADLIGFAPSYINDMLKDDLNGEISPRFIATACVRMGMTFDELFFLDVSIKKNPNDRNPLKQRGQVKPLIYH